MRRFTFYIFAAFFTFAIGCLIVFGYFWGTTPKEIKTETEENSQILTTENKPSTSLYYDLFKSQYENKFPEPVERQAPFCKDKRILPVWNLIQKDEYFRRQSGEDFSTPNCSDMFEFLSFDLNNDGKKEIILRGNSSDLCGGTGNCGFWIFGKMGNSYRKILSASDLVDVNEMGDQIEKIKTKGYFDILLKGHLNAADTSYAYFKFDGEKYKSVKNLVRFCSGENEKCKLITLKEYIRHSH